MKGNLKTFTVTIARDIPRASGLGYPCAWLLWQTDGSALCLTGRPMGRGGLLGLYPKGDAACTDPLRLTREIAEQMRRWKLSGVLLDLPSGPASAELASALCPRLAAQGIEHYLPIELARAAPQGRLILPSAISGGSFAEMLGHFSSLYPPHRLCLELVRTRHDFPMPSPDADGIPLEKEAFDALQEQAGGSYYSPELCSRYFTYRDDGGSPHFVLFDDAASARAKVLQARAAGLYACFALYAEWGPQLQEIFG